MAVEEKQVGEQRRGNPRRQAVQERTCAVSREQCDPSKLIRFVADPDGAIVPDLRRKLPGRGVWVTARADYVAQAAKKNVFARSLKQPVRVDLELSERVEALLETDARQSLAMVNKAGLLVSGAFQVEKLIKNDTIAGLIQARDGSADGARKLNQVLFRHLGARADDIPLIEIFDSSQLGLALGQTNVIHAALRPGAATDAFLVRARRLVQYRADKPKVQAAMARRDRDVKAAEVEDK